MSNGSSGMVSKRGDAAGRRPGAAALALAALACAAALALAGCGFQLSASNLSAAFATARVEADASVDFADQLGEALRRVGAAVVEGEADVVLRLTRQRQTRRTASVTADGGLAEYELAFEVEIAAVAGDGTVLIPARMLHTERVARLARGNLLGSSDEESLLGLEMRGQISRRIVRSLAAVVQTTTPIPSDRGG